MLNLLHDLALHTVDQSTKGEKHPLNVQVQQIAILECTKYRCLVVSNNFYSSNVFNAHSHRSSFGGTNFRIMFIVFPINNSQLDCHNRPLIQLVEPNH
jgi:hypothetical protein